MSDYCSHIGPHTLQFDTFGQPCERCSQCGELWILQRVPDPPEQSNIFPCGCDACQTKKEVIGIAGLASLSVQLVKLQNRIKTVEDVTKQTILPNLPHAKKRTRNRPR